MDSLNDSTTTNENKKENIIVVGAHTALGELLIQSLESDPSIEEFWVLDIKSPKRSKSRKLSKIKFVKLDLVKPGADALLADKLKELEITTLVHCALKTNPIFNWMDAHELEVIGTLNLVNAAKAAKVRKFILTSTTAVYGASPKNPNYIKESQPPKHTDLGFIRDKIEAEKIVSRLYEEAPDMFVSILRFCLILGPQSRNYFTKLFRRPAIPTLLGYDPLMQFIHEEDAIRALRKTMTEDYRTTFNIVGKSVIPLSYVLREVGKIRLPMISTFAYPLMQALWTLHAVSIPGNFLNYLRYMWVADGEKAKTVMNFEPKLSSKEAFVEFAKATRLEEYKWAQ
jgi:UDP-glucose 4-epimerase